MGQEWIERVVLALKNAGIRAQRGYPAGQMPCLEGPAAGVSVAQMEADATVLVVRVYCPPSLGGVLCEDTALAAAEVLRTLGGSYRVDSCRFDSKAGLFCCPVKAVFTRPSDLSEWEVRVNGETMPYAVSFKATYGCEIDRRFDPNNGTPIFDRDKDGWRLRIEELLPPDTPPENENMEIFPVHYSRGENTELYEHCIWETMTLEPVASGLRRIRVARSARPPIINPESR